LSVAFADELPDAFTPPDELVEGVLTAGDGSVLYGDSNSGKTFFVIDMAAAVARGVSWMGRNTEPGLVVYLAAESPASVRGRLQAYQRHHGVRVPNFAIVQSPIDLFDGDADTEAVIAVVRQLERQRGQKVRLIVGDTLARLSAGANENAGQDMGLVVRRFDRIRSACNAHFLLIHHSGKAAANGARGWSGIRAAVDTEIEVTDSPTGRCAEITKQRDLSTKGERIGFRLDTVTLGTTKWGAAATSCVVVPADAPDKPQGKRVSEVGGAVHLAAPTYVRHQQLDAVHVLGAVADEPALTGHCLVWREGWVAQHGPLDAATAGFMGAVLDGRSLAEALAAGEVKGLGAQPDFDFSAWLQAALRHEWLHRVVQRPT
jgi:KaiC/GvpD/RAD55 family RecA-like ATPase